jgi:type I restriction enzyme S subunit
MALDELDVRRVDLIYLANFLRWRGFSDVVSGSSQPQITGQNIGRVEVPLPPLNEQRQIAAILDQADALRRKRRESVAQLDCLASSAFSDAYQSLEGQRRKFSLAELAAPDRHTFGNGPFGSDLLTSELTDEGVPVVYIRDIRDGRYERVSHVCVTPQKAKDLAFCGVRSGDVLIAKVGDPPGISAIYPEGESDAIVTQDVVRLRPNLNLVHPEYLVAALNSSIGGWLISQITVEATRSRFSLKDFKALKVQVPSLAAQSEIVSLLVSVANQRAAALRHLAELNFLFASLQHRAFNGELTAKVAERELAEVG